MNQHGFIILGMHRSGTSALGGVLHHLGVDLSAHLVPAGADNPKGFWEHQAVVEINERLFQALGYWHEEIALLPPAWTEHPEVRALQTEMRHVLQADFAHSRSWAIKDPRLCRTLPAWQNALQSLGGQCHSLLMQRHPFEVAHSLARRNHMGWNKALMLWLLHTMEALIHADPERSTLLDYRDLMQNWEQALAPVLALLPPPNAAQKQAVADFLDAGLWHERTPEPPPAHPQLLRWVNLGLEVLQETEPTTRQRAAQALLQELTEQRCDSAWHAAQQEDSADKTRLLFVFKQGCEQLKAMIDEQQQGQQQLQQALSEYHQAVESLRLNLNQAQAETRHMADEHHELHDAYHALRTELEHAQHEARVIDQARQALADAYAQAQTEWGELAAQSQEALLLEQKQQAQQTQLTHIVARLEKLYEHQVQAAANAQRLSQQQTTLQLQHQHWQQQLQRLEWLHQQQQQAQIGAQGQLLEQSLNLHQAAVHSLQQALLEQQHNHRTLHEAMQLAQNQNQILREAMEATQQESRHLAEHARTLGQAHQEAHAACENLRLMLNQQQQDTLAVQAQLQQREQAYQQLQAGYLALQQQYQHEQSETQKLLADRWALLKYALSPRRKG